MCILFTSQQYGLKICTNMEPKHWNKVQIFIFRGIHCENKNLKATCKHWAIFFYIDYNMRSNRYHVQHSHTVGLMSVRFVTLSGLNTTSGPVLVRVTCHHYLSCSLSTPSWCYGSQDLADKHWVEIDVWTDPKHLLWKRMGYATEDLSMMKTVCRHVWTGVFLCKDSVTLLSQEG